MPRLLRTEASSSRPIAANVPPRSSVATRIATGSAPSAVLAGSLPMTAARTFFALAIFLLALGPRLVGLDTFVTTDEIFWAGRTGNFSRALLGGRLNSTFQTGHPGVTTLWTGLVGMG